MATENSTELQYTGERMVPDAADPDTFWEHVYRYRFAAGFVPGRDVLDIACGEGYGSSMLLKAGAKSLIGVDIAQEAVDHAKSKYGIDARVGSGEQIPLPDRSVDLIVSFETIEHVPSPRQFLDECKRVCRPGGAIIVSTPDTRVYGSKNNPFHCSEMTVPEFLRIVRDRFANVRLFTQRPTYAPWWSPRSFATSEAPLLKIRGFKRLQRILRSVTCPEVTLPLSAESRSAAMSDLSGGSPSRLQFANPYAIHPPTFLADDRSEYVIAVARNGSESNPR